ncbi:hypothetical protein U0070_015348, partial [Myodes glareolus]
SDTHWIIVSKHCYYLYFLQIWKIEETRIRVLAGLCSEVCFQDGTLFLHSHRTKEQRDQIMDEAVKKINILNFIYERFCNFSM